MFARCSHNLGHPHSATEAHVKLSCVLKSTVLFCRQVNRSKTLNLGSKLQPQTLHNAMDTLHDNCCVVCLLCGVVCGVMLCGVVCGVMLCGVWCNALWCVV
jgi:hypothetical protein